MAKKPQAEYVDQETGEEFDQIPEGLEAGLVDETVGFPPYWTPMVGKKLYAKPVAIDTRDSKHNRYVLEAGHNTTCMTGPHDEAEKVVVMKGENFTMSVYAALPLDRFFGEWVLIQVMKKRELASGNDLWVFSCKVDAEAKKRIAANRIALARQHGAAAGVQGAKVSADSLPVT